MSVSVIIPHYWPSRRQNLTLLIAALNDGSVKPDEIIIWNNDVDAHLDSVPPNVSVIRAHRNVGCMGRFLAAMTATSEFVMFQDNDVKVEPEGLERLLIAYEETGFFEPIVAFEGRKLKLYQTYEHCDFVDGKHLAEPLAVDIMIGRCELVRRKVVNGMLSHIPFGERMDDIWFSYAAKCLDIGRYVVPYAPGEGFVNLPECGVGAVRGPDHMPLRDALCRQLFPTEMGA